MTFNYLDLILAGIIVVLAVRCIFRGFVEEFLSMAALIFGIGGGVFFSGMLGNILAGWIGKTMWNPLIGFLAAFIIIYVLIKILEGALHNFFDRFNLEKLDKVLGFLLGLVEGVLMAAVIVFILHWLREFPFLNTDAVLKDSFAARLVLPLFVSV
ncbi:MAG: CvpA family protein [Spirochaetales bacterium]|nr:CvpA family protein [Spirochaetales bacterium]